MKRYLLFAVGIVVLLGITFSIQPLKAQVYGEFDTIRTECGISYQELNPSLETVIPPGNFGIPPSWITDYDDGYYLANIGFPFEFNGEVYTQVYICINGFITFSPPPFVPAKVSKGLFINSVSYPKNVAAPFWGDHVIRRVQEHSNGYKDSKISYYYDDVAGVFTVQWKDLNINDGTVKSSVGNFQVKLYQSTDPLSVQGNIEFCYGQIGGNQYDQSTLVVTKNASVGLKGEGNDFMNGLWPNTDPLTQRTKTDLSNAWTPSGATDCRILFKALARYNIEEFWGDGDADFSKGIGGKHYGMAQNRYVTVNDAAKIMRSIARGIPLDSARRRDAYHGDVNHNGRYWWKDTTVVWSGGPQDSLMRFDIPWRDMFYGDDLPPDLSSIKMVFFQATEYDAAMILHYISARIPELPWVLDTIPQYGKISANVDIASGLKFGSPVLITENTYKIPVYLNGYSKGAVGAKFDINGRVVNVESFGDENNRLSTDYENSTVVLAGTGEYDNKLPICYVTVASSNKDLKVSKIRFNDKNIGDISFALLSVEQGNDGNDILSQNTPNPFDTRTEITVNIKDEGYYSLAVYDALGNKVKTLTSGDILKTGNYNYVWNGTDDLGNKVESGVYLYRLTGENVSLSKKLLFTK